MSGIIQQLAVMSVADVMTKPVHTVTPLEPITVAAREMLDEKISSLPVVDEQGRCVGIVTTRDLITRIERRGGNPIQDAEALPENQKFVRDEAEACRVVAAAADSVGAYMSEAFQSISPDEPVLRAARIMQTQHIHHLPVLDEGACPVGLVSATDLIALLARSIEEQRVSVGR